MKTGSYAAIAAGLVLLVPIAAFLLGNSEGDSPPAAPASEDWKRLQFSPQNPPVPVADPTPPPPLVATYVPPPGGDEAPPDGDEPENTDAGDARARDQEAPPVIDAASDGLIRVDLRTPVANANDEETLLGALLSGLGLRIEIVVSG